jgi:hypothetical protein
MAQAAQQQRDPMRVGFAFVRRTAALALAIVVLAVVPAMARSAVRIPCANAQGTSYRFLTRPGGCTQFGNSNARSVNLRDLRWRQWGGASATATGFERGFHRPFSRIPVGVIAFGRRSCGSRQVYTGLRASSRFGTTTVRLSCNPRP